MTVDYSAKVTRLANHDCLLILTIRDWVSGVAVQFDGIGTGRVGLTTTEQP